ALEKKASRFPLTRAPFHHTPKLQNSETLKLLNSITPPLHHSTTPSLHHSITPILMKSAYELAMERLNKAAPTRKLTADQKKQIGELESKYAAKIAERELFVKGEIVKAIDRGDAEA